MTRLAQEGRTTGLHPSDGPVSVLGPYVVDNCSPRGLQTIHSASINHVDVITAMTCRVRSALLLLTRGVFLVLLQDTEPLVQAVVGHGGSVVPAAVVLVHHPPSLPLQRGHAGSGGGEAEHRRPKSGHENQPQSEHDDRLRITRRSR